MKYWLTKVNPANPVVKAIIVYEACVMYSLLANQAVVNNLIVLRSLGLRQHHHWSKGS